MPSFVTVTGGVTAQAQDVNQLINALNGSAGNAIPISLTALNDSVNFALAVKNADPTNSRSLQVLRSNNNVLIQADASGVIVSPDGGATTGQVLTVNATQTLTNKTLNNPTITGTMGIGNAPGSNVGIFMPSGLTLNASGTVAEGANFSPTLVAQANGDTLYGVIVQPTYNDNAKTGVKHVGILATGDCILGNGVAMGNADTLGFAFIPGGGGAASGVPLNSGAGFAIRYNSSTNTIQVYNGAWRSTAALT